MTKLIALNVLIGALIPVIIAIAVQAKLPRWANMALTVVVCGIAGVLTVWAGEAGLHWVSFNAENILITLAVIFAASQAVYSSWWKASPVVAFVNTKTNV